MSKLKSYLEQEILCLHGKCNATSEITGVPQGLDLGPVLFCYLTFSCYFKYQETAIRIHKLRLVVSFIGKNNNLKACQH